MKEQIAKIAGWFLLLIGVAAIVWILFYSYNIFTAQAPVPVIFKTEEQVRVFDQDSESFEQTIEQALQKQIASLVNQETINQILNLIAWSIFSGIVIFAGSQIANLGIKLIKD